MIIVDASYVSMFADCTAETMCESGQNLTLEGSRKRQYLPHSYIDKCLKGTVVNLGCHSYFTYICNLNV